MAFQLLEVVGADGAMEAAVEADQRETLWCFIGKIEAAEAEHFD
jgi:hypothetical protein